MFDISEMQIIHLLLLFHISTEIFKRQALSELGEGVAKGPHFVVDVGQKFLNLPFGVKELDRLSVRIIAYSKWSGDGCGKVNHSLLGILKALRNKVNGLMFCDWVFLQSSDLRVKCLQLRLS